jgi:hypothetical protein
VECLVKTPDSLYEILDKKDCGLDWSGLMQEMERKYIENI